MVNTWPQILQPLLKWLACQTTLNAINISSALSDRNPQFLIIKLLKADARLCKVKNWKKFFSILYHVVCSKKQNFWMSKLVKWGHIRMKKPLNIFLWPLIKGENVYELNLFLFVRMLICPLRVNITENFKVTYLSGIVFLAGRGKFAEQQIFLALTKISNNMRSLFPKTLWRKRCRSFFSFVLDVEILPF